MKFSATDDVPYRNLDLIRQQRDNDSGGMNYIPKRKKILFTIASCGIISTLLYFYYLSAFKTDESIFEHIHDATYSIWPRFHRVVDNAESMQFRCFNKSLKPFLSELECNLQQWNKADDVECSNWLSYFKEIYSLDFRVGNVKIPSPFLPKVSEWLNNDEALIKEINAQQVIQIFNEFTNEHAAFSPLRANRPQSKSTNVMEYVDKIVKDSSKSCDFCNYETRTSEDVFGRIKTKGSFSAANTFKVDRWHSLIIPFQHDPLALTEDDVIDMFRASLLWFEKVHSMEEKYKYPWMLWDSMPHAGASQIHPHIHVGLNKGFYVGYAEGLRIGAEHYFKKFGRNYFTDLTSIHTILGLTVTFGEATAIAQLTSRKDTEITILSNHPGEDFAKLMFRIIKVFYDMGIYDFSSLTVLPIKSSSTEGGSLPVVTRIASRGDVSSVRSEISSFELYQFSNLNVDPYDMVKRLRSSLKNSN